MPDHPYVSSTERTFADRIVPVKADWKQQPITLVRRSLLAKLLTSLFSDETIYDHKVEYSYDLGRSLSWSSSKECRIEDSEQTNREVYRHSWLAG